MRIDGEVGFVLHTTPYRETSLLVDLLTVHHGRIRCVAKGYRKPNKKGISRALFPYTEHQFSWQGRGDLKTLTHADAVQAPVFLDSACLFTGLYVNELFIGYCTSMILTKPFSSNTKISVTAKPGSS